MSDPKEPEDDDAASMWRDLARMEAEVVDPEEEATLVYESDKLKLIRDRYLARLKEKGLVLPDPTAPSEPPPAAAPAPATAGKPAPRSGPGAPAAPRSVPGAPAAPRSGPGAPAAPRSGPGAPAAPRSGPGVPAAPTSGPGDRAPASGSPKDSAPRLAALRTALIGAKRSALPIRASTEEAVSPAAEPPPSKPGAAELDDAAIPAELAAAVTPAGPQTAASPLHAQPVGPALQRPAAPDPKPAPLVSSPSALIDDDESYPLPKERSGAWILFALALLVTVAAALLASR